MEKGQIVEINIEDMSQEGQGIGRADGMVVFVPGTIIGDVAKAQLTKVKKNYAFSKLVDVVRPSSARSSEFDCPYFYKGCGGCPYGEMTYETQTALKEKQVRDKLQRLAGLDEPMVLPMITMQDSDNDGMGHYRYRNKAQFPVSTGGIITRKGGIVENLGAPAVGFYRAKSHEVVDCGDCYLQSMAAMAAADALRTFMEEDNITAWDPKWEKGLMRHLIVKTAFNTGEVMVILVINGNGVPNIQKLIEMLDDAIYEVGYSLESVVLSIKKSDGIKKGTIKNRGGKKKSHSGNLHMNSATGSNGSVNRHISAGMSEIMGEKNVVVAGKPVIKDIIGDLEFEISPASFYQVNSVQMKRLYDKVREYCGFEAADDSSAVMSGCERSEIYRGSGFSGSADDLEMETIGSGDLLDKVICEKDESCIEFGSEILSGREIHERDSSVIEFGSEILSDGEIHEKADSIIEFGSNGSIKGNYNNGIGSCSSRSACDKRSIHSEDGNDEFARRNGEERGERNGKRPIILDLYCGVGSIGLYCADKAEAVVGIEVVKEAVIDANRNAVINGIVNARYICGKAEEVLSEYAAYDVRGACDMCGMYDTPDSFGTYGHSSDADSQKSSECISCDDTIAENKNRSIDPDVASLIKRADVAIIDPPRAGCKPELLEAVANVGVDRIVYVSCDPATLARDIKLLGELGYEFVEATPVDMFPCTGHVETIVLIQKKNS